MKRSSSSKSTDSESDRGSVEYLMVAHLTASSMVWREGESPPSSQSCTWKGFRERERERDRGREREIEREREREREKQRERGRARERQKKRQSESERDRERKRQSETEREREGSKQVVIMRR